MKIAQVAPLWERVPPLTYGGTELVVSQLTDELVRRGHEVTLFASGDSQTLACLEAVCPRAIRLDPEIKDYTVYEMLEISQVYERAAEFDLIHSHIGLPVLAIASKVKTPTIHTLHGNFTPENSKLFQLHHQQPYISISNAQRQLDLNYLRTVYNGIDVEKYSFFAQPQQPPYLAFLGRLSPEKGPHHAIAVAKQIGLPLKLAGKIDASDRSFFEREIAPQIDGKQIEYIGEVNRAQKIELLGNASVTLFPITWDEPFGLVMVESMATGTPVIGLNRCSVPEVIAPGKSGFICNTIAEMVAALSQALELNRQTCREYVEQHFGIAQMVDGYEAAYQELLTNRIAQNGRLLSQNLALS
ncbi:MAG: glycosyltransferase family 4 protein [Xenococcaceae cyanobacterium]